jgi:lipoprotein-anchoring transpeptidase ErfK/SrfK
MKALGWLCATLSLALWGCGPGGPAPTTRGPALSSAAVAEIAAINTAQAPATGAQAAPSPAIIKAEVLLARAHASPGVIDGLPGSNLRRAVTAFEDMNALPGDGELSPALWSRLDAPGPPAAAVYVETAQDVSGPFYPFVGEDFVAASKLASPGYSSPLEMLAARFHMSAALLKALNPGADFQRAGQVLVVVNARIPPLPEVKTIQVDKAKASVRAYDASGVMVGSFPATVGSTERPSPSGVREVKGVSFNPIYTYDPAKLTWGPRSHGRFIIRSGPNNPVGLVWIALNAPGYGIHGSPNPDKIGKTASHGCVRLTNWDALLLAHAVRYGDVVTFINQRPQA